MTLTVAPTVKGYAITVEAIGADGEAQKCGYTSSFDGSESSAAGNPGFDAAVARSTGTGGTITSKKAGKVVSTTTSALSDDGKTRTVTVNGIDAQGKEVTAIAIAVYDRQ
jgi:hypothetical protein